MPVENVGGSRYRSYGTVKCDGVVGGYELFYDDLTADGLPIQSVRRSIGDNIYIDEERIGSLEVEYDDVVSDAVAGVRTFKANVYVKLLWRGGAMIIGEAEFQIMDSWGRGVRMAEAVQPVASQAMVNAMVASLLKELLEGML